MSQQLPCMGSDVDLVKISVEPLSQEKVTEFVRDPSSGAISIFIGNCWLSSRPLCSLVCVNIIQASPVVCSSVCVQLNQRPKTREACE